MQKTILTPNALQTDNTNTQTNSTNTNINLQNVPDAGGMTGHAIPIGAPPLPANQSNADTPAPVMKNMDVLTAEDKLYEKLGIKYNDTHMFGVSSRRKGRLLLLAIGVTSYILYKKYKK